MTRLREEVTASDRVQRIFPTDLKVQIVQRVEAGDQFSAIAKELGVVRKSIYERRASDRALGVAVVTVVGCTAPRSGIDAP